MAFSVFLHAVLAVHKASLYDAEDHGEILLIRHLNPAILIGVIASEYVRQPLGETDTENYWTEQVFREKTCGEPISEAHASPSSSTETLRWHPHRKAQVGRS